MTTESFQTAGQRLATPPSRRRPGNALSTSVSRSWFWCGWDDGGRGGWRLLATGNTHRARLIETDPHDSDTITDRDYLTAKGFIPIRDIPADDVRHRLLPVNAEQMRRDHRMPAQMPDDLDKHLAEWRKKFEDAA